MAPDNDDEMCPLSLLARFGVRVVAVEDLPEDVIWVESHHLALVRAQLDAEGREWAAHWLIEHSAETLLHRAS